VTRRAWVSWSSGKDSALALAEAKQDPDLDVVGLLVTFNASADRVAMHAVRRELVLAQAQRLNLPVTTVELPYPCPNGEYEQRMGAALAEATNQGVEAVIFGDLHLTDVRAYREDMMRGSGVEPLFPLWGRPTDTLATAMFERGTQAVLTCVDPGQVPRDLVGRSYDPQLLADLPLGADPCGENGEFHTFVWDAPDFSAPVPVRTGNVVERDGFVYCDLLPAPGTA